MQSLVYDIWPPRVVIRDDGEGMATQVSAELLNTMSQGKHLSLNAAIVTLCCNQSLGYVCNGFIGLNQACSQSFH